MGTGKIVKLTIQGYSDVTFNKKVGGEFKTLINPEKVLFSRKIEMDEQQAPNTTTTPQKFKRIAPPELDLSILFDATGVIMGAESGEFGVPVTKSSDYKSIAAQVKEFEDILIKYEGDHHKPNHLWVTWGTINFKGVLSDYSIEYKLFNPDGSPLRGVAKIKLKDAKDEEYRAAKENKKSPDLTHIRQVVEGNTLPRMCDEIYGDSKYYLEVAKINGITNFRKLTPGQRINFPPIEKVAK